MPAARPLRFTMRPELLRLALPLSVALPFLPACYQVPVTGRSAVILTDDKAVIELSAKEFADMKRRYPLARDRAGQERVARVGERLARVVFWDAPGADWEFVLFDVPKQINAFALPGGKVGVFTGLLRIIDNDDQLASVLAHEIAHVTAKHTHERLTQAGLVQSGGLLAGGAVAASTGSLTLGNNAAQGMGLLGGIGVIAFDRGKEKEADHIGLIYMARAGYNPEEAIKVFEKLEAEAAGQPVPSGWFSTHPSNPERIIQLMDLMPEALAIYRQSGTTRTPTVVK